MSRSPAAIRATAAATAPDQSAPERAPSAKATSVGAAGASCGAGTTGGGSWPPTAMVVSHHVRPRRPTSTSGTTRAAPLGESAEKEMDPNATGPVPGRSTSSRTTACATTSRHQRWACSNRYSPCASKDSARPQPTSPEPPRTQDRTSVAATSGTSASRGPGSSIATVRATTGAGRPVGAGPGPGSGEDVTASKPTTAAARRPGPLPSRPARPGDRCRPARRRHQGG